MRMVAYGLIGLLLGALGGFWLGLMLALIYVDATPVSCSDGICSYLALEIG